MVIEFDRPIARAQNALLSATYVLNELPEEEKFTELCKRIDDALLQCPKSYDVRNIFLFMILNSDAEIIDVIAEDENYCHLINTLPRLSQTLLLRLIFAADGMFFIRELITFGPSALAISVLDTITTSDDLHPSKLQLFKMPLELSKACFHKIILSDGESSLILEKLFNFFQSLQLYGYSWYPKTKTFTDMNEDVKKGLYYIQYLELMSFTLQLEYMDHYDCWEGYLMGCATKFEKSECKSLKPRTVMELKWECRNIVLSQLNKITRELTVDNWLGLAEVTTCSGVPFQQKIGVAIFGMMELLQEFYDDPRLPVLPDFLEAAKPFAIEPEIEVDDTKNVSFEEIKVKLSSKESIHAKWMKSLLQHSNTWEDKEAVEIIKSNSNLLDETDVEFILDTVIEKLREEKNSIEGEMLKSLCYEVLKHLPLVTILDVQYNFHRKYGPIKELRGSECNALLKIAFNKVLFESKELSDECQCEVVRLFIQDPNAVILRAFKLGLQNTNSAKAIAKLLRLLKPTSQTLLCDWIASISEQCPFSRLEMEAFPRFILELIKEDVLCREQFLRANVIYSVHKAMVSFNWNVVSMWLTAMQGVLHATVSSSGKLGSIAVLLVYVGQVLEYCQQSIDEFQLSCLSARDQTIGIIQSLICFELSEAEKDWFESYIRKYSGMTQCQLAIFATDKPPANASIDFGLCFNAQVKTPEFAAFILAEMLPFLTGREWIGVAHALKKLFADHEDKCYSVFRSFQQAITLLIEACAGIDLNVNSNHQSCLDYCVRCLGTILKSIALPGLQIQNYLPVLEETLHLLSKLPVKVWDQAGMQILPILVNVLHRVPPKLEALNTLSALIITCPVNQSRELFEEKLKVVFKDAIDEVRETEMSDSDMQVQLMYENECKAQNVNKLMSSS